MNNNNKHVIIIIILFDLYIIILIIFNFFKFLCTKKERNIKANFKKIFHFYYLISFYCNLISKQSNLFFIIAFKF